MAYDISKAVAAAKNKGKDMTQASSGGGDSYELPAEGFVRLRFVGYFEIGKHESTWQGQKKVKDTVELVFELSGPKHQPRVSEDGNTKYPARVTKRMTMSLSEKANFFQLFTAMNWEGKATTMAELLGDAFVGKIVHNKKKREGKDVTYVNLEDIRKPFATNPETGDEYKLEVDAPLTELKLFLWDFADAEMWDALFIEGTYEERKNDKGEVTSPARSKNVLQEKIKRALNWKGSPVFDYAAGKVGSEDAAALDAAVGETDDVGEDGDDPMAGIQ